LEYASKHLSKTEIEKLYADLLSFNNQCITKAVLLNVKSLSRSLVVQGLLNGDITAGDARLVTYAILKSFIFKYLYAYYF